MNKVEIRSFFSQVYIDEELRRLSDKYQVEECDGTQQLSSLGKAQREILVAKLLVLARTGVGGKNTLVGVSRKEFEGMLSDGWLYTYGLIKEGMLRQKRVEGRIVVFPTEKLLINQRISLRQQS